MGLFPKDRDLTQPLREVRLPVRASDWQERPAQLKVRLDTFLARFLRWRTRASLQGLIHEGYVSVEAARPERPDASGEPQVELRPGRRLLHAQRPREGTTSCASDWSDAETAGQARASRL